LGFGERDVLPVLRSKAADRVAGWGVSVAWPVAGLHLIAESARMGLRELGRLETVAEKGREALVGADRRSRLPDTLDALAARLRSAPQTATALLREMQAKGVVKAPRGAMAVSLRQRTSGSRGVVH
jgi:hypothetical protein